MTLDCLMDRDGDLSNISISGEIYLDVQHCLMGHLPPKTASESHLGHISPTSSGQATPASTGPDPNTPRSRPRTDFSYVTDVYSHPQAFGQCQRFLSTYLKHAHCQEVSSTSRAAEIVKQENNPAFVAIASQLAAKMKDLTLLAVDIQDRQDNTTRFLILHRGISGGPSEEPCHSRSTLWKSLLTFSVKHESHGALAKALLVFESQYMNLTHFDSRPSQLRPWHYIFIVECRSRGTESSVTKQIQNVLVGLQNVTERCKCLGFWRDSSAQAEA